MRSRAAPRLRGRLPPFVAAPLLAAVLLVVAGGPQASGAAAASVGAGSAPAVWTWPIAAPHPVARGYLAPPTPYGAGHRGIDIRAPAGAEVRAPADGVVHFAGFVVDRPVLSVQHAGGVLSSFEPVSTPLHAGDVVHRGDVIGVVLAGHCDPGPCLHLGARVDGAYVNPLLFLGGVPPAVLYPTRTREAHARGCAVAYALLRRSAETCV
jgi:murein DD-endopeptidase MepM/ murein hydrolase activator NlpD